MQIKKFPYSLYGGCKVLITEMLLMTHRSVFYTVAVKRCLTSFGMMITWASFALLVCLSDLQEGQVAKRTIKLSLLGEVDELEPAILNPVEQLPESEPLFEDKDEDNSKLLEWVDLELPASAFWALLSSIFKVIPCK